jgi:hypothetical protein
LKRAGFRHIKTLALARELGIPRQYAVGVLCEFWSWVAGYAPTGALGHLFQTDAAAAVGWEGDASLVDALHRSGWILQHGTHSYVVSGWSDHCEDSVHTALARAGKLFWNGVMPKVSRLAGRERDECLERLRVAQDEYQRFAAANAATSEGVTVSKDSPRNVQGQKRPAVASVLVSASVCAERTAQQQPPLPPAQRPLAMGPMALPPRPTQPFENVEALRKNIAELAQLWGVDFDRAAIAVTSGQVNGRRVCAGTLSFETMSDKHMRRSIVDSNTAIARAQREASA